jgi:putative zinc finger/helix-turn-helix YgiT family protein
MKTTECDFCSGVAELQIKKTTHTFRGEEFSVNENFYKCTKCGAEFTLSDLDNLNINQVYNQYREKHKLPFPEEIKMIREQYQLSATKMSAVLGFGVNGYRNYENGEIPTLPHGKLITLAKSPSIFKGLFENNGREFKTKEIEELDKIITSLIEKREHWVIFNSNQNINFVNNEPNEFTGFKKPNIDKIKNILLYFLKHITKEYSDKWKLNKLFFYTDFLHFKTHGYSITGIEYRAITYGPVPSNYDFLYNNLEHIENVIKSSIIKASDNRVVQLFEPVSSCNDETFNEKELKSISEIVTKFKDIPSWDLVELSHNEKGWQELEGSKEIISYQSYAFDLIGA